MPAQRQCGRGGLRADGQWRQHRPDVHRPQRIVTGGIEPAPDPAGVDRRLRGSGLPDIHAAEMAVVRLRVTHAADDGQLLALPQLVEPGHRRVQSERVVQSQHLRRRVRKLWTSVVVGGIAIRNKGVQAIVAAVHGQHHQYLLTARQWPRGGTVHQVLPADAGDAGSHRGTAGGPGRDQELASVQGWHGSFSLCGRGFVDVHTTIGGLDLQWTRYSGEFRAAATNCGGLTANGLRTAAVRSEKFPMPSK